MQRLDQKAHQPQSHEYGAHDLPPAIAMMTRNKPRPGSHRSLTAVGLFSGVGGFELGLQQSGIDASLLCEIDTDARKVLGSRFKQAEMVEDILRLRSLPHVDVLTAGFPCQDLSQVGRTTGIHGARSGLVKELFRLLSPKHARPRYVVLENVPFMLRLKKGHAMSVITAALESRGYAWAYRTVDARSFGLPQRRRRVIIVASRQDDPRPILFPKDSEQAREPANESTPKAFGFYWTEGNTGLGWAPDCLPALKPGSALSIPSPPALWSPRRHTIGLPHIEDAERLQGFPKGWTIPRGAQEDVLSSPRVRWRLVGNALPVPIAAWLGQQLQQSNGKYPNALIPIKMIGWSSAGWGHKGHRYVEPASEFPVHHRWPDIESFLSHPTRPLSARATLGFLTRLERSRLRKDDRFLKDLATHYRRESRRS